MLIKVYGSAVFGIEATTIVVEVNIDKGIGYHLKILNHKQRLHGSGFSWVFQIQFIFSDSLISEKAKMKGGRVIRGKAKKVRLLILPSKKSEHKCTIC